MKKYFFMALLASLIILPCCSKESKKDTEPEIANPIIEALNYCKSIYGADTTAVFAKLVSDGWTLTCHDSLVIAYSKLNDNNIFHYISFNSNISTVDRIWLKLYDENEDVELLTGVNFQESMAYVGDSIIFAGKSIPFMSLLYEVGEDAESISDFTLALNSVVDIYEDYNLSSLWADSSLSSMFILSKKFDEDKGQNCVQITILP